MYIWTYKEHVPLTYFLVRNKIHIDNINLLRLNRILIIQKNALLVLKLANTESIKLEFLLQKSLRGA